MAEHDARSAVLWNSIELILNYGLRFTFSIILARLLFPEDFGTIALLALFLGLGSLFVEAGFSAALIQKQDTTHLDESSIFWFNLIAGVIVTLILYLSAPLIATLFDLEILGALTKFMAFAIIISAFGTVHHALLVKQLNFRALMKVGVTSTVIAGVVGVYLAMNNYGVWALAIQSILGALISTILLWVTSSWRPMRVMNTGALKRLLGFSGYIFAAGFLQTIYKQGYALLIGKFFGVRDLGLYNRADSTQQQIVDLPIGLISRVTFPIYSRLKDDTEKLREMVKKSLRSVMFITTPLMLGLMVLSEPFIVLIFGQQWVLSVPILQVLCFAGLLLPIHDVNVNILKAKGHADLNFRINIIKKITGISFLFIGSYFGIMGVAIGCVIQSIVGLFINGFYTKKIISYGMLEQIRDCFPSFLNAILMSVLIIYTSNIFEVVGVLDLLLQVIIGVLFYLLVSLIFNNGLFKDILGFIQGEKYGS